MVVNNREIELVIKDAGGEERFRFILPKWTKGAKVTLLVFDLGRFYTFMHLGEWLELLKECVSSNRALLVGAKADTGDAREIGTEEAERFAQRTGCWVTLKPAH